MKEKTINHFKIDRSKPAPLFVQVKNIITKWINSGALSTHDRIYSERELSNMYDISRQTVRQAINELVLKGVLYRQPGKGTYVAPQKVTQDLLHVTSFTQMILDWGKTTTAETVTCEKKVAPPFARDLLSLDLDLMVVEYIRVRLVDEEPAAIHRSYIPAKLGESLRLEKNESPSLIQYLGESEGKKVTHSEEKMEPTVANKYEAELLDIEQGFPLQLITGRLLTDEDEPVECHKSLYRGDKFQFAFEGRTT